MNEFKLWHKKIKEFLRPDKFLVFGKDGIANNPDCEICNYIGIKDINNNKIYADSSIIEFFHKSIKQIGIVKYSIDSAYYYFDIKNGSGHIPLYMVNFEKIKIIDNIQENKLGLI